MVVASGRSQRHVSALADHVARRLKEEGLSGVRIEGMPNADWVLIDAGDIIVHIFRPEVREFYNLERLWGADSLPSPVQGEAPVDEDAGDLDLDDDLDEAMDDDGDDASGER
jgi:ribosome-associated protein